MSKWYRDLFGFGFGEHIMFAPDDGTGSGGAGAGDGADKDKGEGGDKDKDTGKKDGDNKGTETQKPNWGDAFKDEGFLTGLKGALGDVLTGLGMGKQDDSGAGKGDQKSKDDATGDDGIKKPEVNPEQIKADALKEFQKEQERIGSVRNDAKAKALEFNWTAKGLLTLDKYCPTASKEDAVKFVEEINSMINEQAEARFKNGGKPGNSGSGDGKPADPDPKAEGKKDFEARHGKK